MTAPVGPALRVSSSSLFPTPRLCTTPLSSTRLECGYAEPCVTPVIGAKTRRVTEPSAELPLTRKANTRRRARADTPSPRENALRDEIANIARRTGLCADIEVIVDHPAIDPEHGARMDVRISKTGAQNADELIDVQVTSPFCV